MNAPYNYWLEWAQRCLPVTTPFQDGIARQVLSPLGAGAVNHPGAEVLMRSMRRGGVLDKHLGETGLSVPIGPGSRDRDLLRLSATSRNDPQVVSIGMNVREVSAALAPPGTSDFLIQAVLTWGTGKGFSRAVFDVRQGAQFTIAANIITLSVRYIGTVGPVVQVSASAAYGLPQSGEVALTFTELPVVLGAGVSSAAFRVPAYATRVQWFSPDSPTAPPIPGATIEERSDADPTGRIVTAVAPSSNTFVALGNAVDFIRLINISAAARSYGLIYELHI